VQKEDSGSNALVAAAPAHVREARRLVIDALTPEQITQLSAIGRAVLAATDPDSVRWLDTRDLGD
jgi:hypothetical protein